MKLQLLHAFKGKPLGNTLWLLLEKVCKLTVGLFVGVLVSRHLGPEGMGIWNYGLSIFAFFTVFSTFGLDYITHREFLNKPESSGVIFSTVLVLRLMGASLGVGIPLLYMGITESIHQTSAHIVLILTVAYFVQAFDVIEYYYQAKLLAKRTVIARLIAFFAIALYKYYLVKVNAPLLWFVWSSTIEFLIGAILLVGGWFLRPRTFKMGKVNWALAYSLLKDALPFSFASLLAVLHFKIDQVMITEMLSATENGIYSVAIRIFELLIVLLAVISPSFIPLLANAYKTDNQKFKQSLIHFYGIVSWLGIFCSLGCIILAKPIMAFLYGPAFNGSGQILQLLALCVYPIFISSAITNYLIITNKKSFNLFKTGVGLVLNILLNWLFIPNWGIQGAAISSLVSHIVSMLLIVFFKNKHGHGALLLQALNLKLQWQMLQKPKNN